MWISRAEYRRLLKQLARAERRYESVLLGLTEERAANRTAERWWANALLRAKQAFPMPERPAEPSAVSAPADVPILEPMDPGEYEALVAQAAEYGVSKEGVDLLLRRERGEEI